MSYFGLCLLNLSEKIARLFETALVLCMLAPLNTSHAGASAGIFPGRGKKEIIYISLMIFLILVACV